jgi:hypothetical protein
MAVCRWCGKQSVPDDRFCVACGTPVGHTAPESTLSERIGERAIPHAASPSAFASDSLRTGTLFCGICGTRVAATQAFCQSCGGSARRNMPSEPYAPTPSPIYPSAVPDRSGFASRGRNLVEFWPAALAAAFALIVIYFFLPVIYGLNPEDSLNRALAAYQKHDQSSFDKYVDVNSVLSDWTDQGVSAWLKQQKAGPIESAAAQIVADAMKSNYLPSAAQSVNQWVATGTFPDQPSNPGLGAQSDFTSEFISSAFRELESGDLFYKGIESKSITNNDAALTLRVDSWRNNRLIPVRVSMHYEGKYWRIVKVQDIDGLLERVNGTPKP